ncbi:MAG: PQQ-dependent sugar dehydrogenase [Acidiferrobacterales bacterium]|nr:PQQ-dependent sugar dehydrogenase [Acidiferrobacterales bacterium]
MRKMLDQLFRKKDRAFWASVFVKIFIFALFSAHYSASAFTLPTNFDNVEVVGGLSDPDGLAFSPDGRMFISERITGRLRVATYNSSNDSWDLLATPFHTFDIPKDQNGNPSALRSAGLRDITFDPDFSNNGLIYAFYMKNGDLQNRVVRIRESITTPNTSDPTFGDTGSGGEELLINLPFNDSSASGSHNGGAIEFGGDDFLYITTGDGWEGAFQGDPVQSLSTFTGKVLRIAADGSIPATNPFYGSASGDFRAIFALGLRNPYSMSLNPDNGSLYINEARGTDKAEIYIVEAGANYRHEGANSGIGNDRTPWANAATAGGELITGGAWMPEAGLGDYPAVYNGVYFTALWGGNSSSTGRINYVQSKSNTAVTAFETDVGINGSNGIPVKPVTTRIGPDGDLYYLLTTYQTTSGAVRRVRYTSQETVATPTFSIPGGVSNDPVAVSLSTTTPSAQIYYTTDNATPTTASTLFSGTPINISADTILKARGFRSGFNPSSTASAVYLIGDRPDNIPPNVSAGVDKTVFIGQNVVLDGSGTTDPDGDDDFLTDEQWLQESGPTVTIIDATEEIASFTPAVAGTYVFSLEVSDGFDSASDTVTITAVRAPRVTREIAALYTFEEESGNTVSDTSGINPALNLARPDDGNTSWISGGGIRFSGSSMLNAADNKLRNRCTATDAISVEAWVTPANISQDGPSRIVSFSSTITLRNFTLGQIADSYDMRLRTTTTGTNGSSPSLSAPASTATTALTHVLYSRDASGNATLYKNGVSQVVGSITGNFSNWASDYQMVLGNEVSGDRPWLGDMHLVAIYCAALTEEEAQQNFAAGIPPLAPLEDGDNDNVPDAIDNCPAVPNTNQVNLDGDSFGDACDTDQDNDGVENAADGNPLDPTVCRDLDSDLCDDCSIGSDRLGPLDDFNVSMDGTDTDGDGMCNVGDSDDDNDMVPDMEDNCPLIADSSNNPALCSADEFCLPIRSSLGNVVVVCF